MTTLHPYSGRRTFSSAGLIVIVYAAAVHAGDVLSNLPEDYAGLIVVRNFTELRERVPDVARRSGLTIRVPDVDVLREFGAERVKSIDASKPIVVVMTRPYLEDTSMAARYSLTAEAGAKAGDDRGIRRRGDDSDAVYAIVRDGICTVARNRRAIRAMRAAGDRPSLLTSLDPIQREMFEQAHIVLHLRVDPWRPRVQPFVKVFALAVQAGMHSSTEVSSMGKEEAKVISAFWGYGLGQIERLLNEATSLTLAVELAPEGCRVGYHVAFKNGRSVSKYLSKVERRGIDLWAGIPDRPFLVAFASDWATPTDTSAMCGMIKAVFSDPAISKQIDPAELKKNLALMTECYGQMQGGTMLMDLPTSDKDGFSIYGTYTFDNPATGAAQIRDLCRSNQGMMMIFNPNTGFMGTCETRTRNGVKFEEMCLNVTALKEPFRKEMEQFYGPDSRFCMTLLKDRVAYAISQDRDAIVRMDETLRKGNGIAKQPRFRKTLDMLPKDSNVVTVLNVDSMITMALDATRAAADADPAPTFRPKPSVGEPALVAASCKVHPSAVSGQIFASYEDIGRFVKLGGQFMEAGTAHAPGARPPLPPRVPDQPGPP